MITYQHFTFIAINDCHNDKEHKKEITAANTEQP